MRFEWEENKRLINLRDHAVDFIDMVQMFYGRSTFTIHSPRRGKDRWATIGIVDGRFCLVIWTKRGERRRIVTD